MSTTKRITGDYVIDPTGVMVVRGNLVIEGNVTAADIAAVPSGVTVGTYGSASQAPTVTVDINGRITSAANTPINIASSQVSNFAATARTSVGVGTGLTYNNTTGVFSIDSGVVATVAGIAASTGSALVGHVASGTGAVTTTVQAKLREIVSVKDKGAVGDGVTSDQTALVAAVADAYANGAALTWPAGTYVSTATIPNFHDVQHTGSGVLKRGSETWVISGKTGTQVIYVSTGGNDANDGLTTAQAIATVQGALNVLNAPYMSTMLAKNGNFKIKFAAGTWLEGGSFAGNLVARNWVTVEGEVDGSNIPTTIIDGAASSLTAGLYFDGGPSRLYVKNIASNNFRANSIASGFVFANKGIAQIFTDNLYSNNNLWAGINGDSIGQWNAKGGVHDANTNYNLRARGGIALSIGRSDARMTLKNNLTAVQIRDCCSGHFDYVDIVNHPSTPTGTGLWVTNVSRVVLNSCTLTNCNLGISCGNGSTFGKTDTTFANVNTEFRTSENGTQDQVAGNGGGEGLAYDKFYNRYTLGLVAHGGTPFSTTAYAFATDKTGTADWSFLVPDATTSRFLVGNVTNNAYFRQDWDFANTRVSWVLNGTNRFRINATDVNSGTDNTNSLGTGGARWSVVYAGTGTINTSDEREKTFIDIDSAEIEVAKTLKGMMRKYQFNGAIAEKGEEGARYHFGVGAQSVADVFVEHGLDPQRYALFCYDEWGELPELRDAEGNVTQEYRAAGNRYGIRYDELLCFIIRVM